MGFSSNVLVVGQQARKLLQGERVELVYKTKRKPLAVSEQVPVAKKDKQKKASKAKAANKTSGAVPLASLDDDDGVEVVEMFPVMPRHTKLAARCVLWYISVAAERHV